MSEESNVPAIRELPGQVDLEDRWDRMERERHSALLSAKARDEALTEQTRLQIADFRRAVEVREELVQANRALRETYERLVKAAEAQADALKAIASALERSK